MSTHIWQLDQTTDRRATWVPGEVRLNKTRRQDPGKISLQQLVTEAPLNLDGHTSDNQTLLSENLQYGCGFDPIIVTVSLIRFA
jgi:hypothetical protein